MIVETVVLCPPAPSAPEPYDRSAVVDHLRSGLPDLAVILPAPGQPWVAAVALALPAQVRGPVLPVLAAAAGRYAPALGLSQRAARRTVAGYVLLDTDPPVADADGPEWPDAPVVQLSSPAAPAGSREHARLRGWTRVELPALDPGAIAGALTVLCRDP